MTCSYSPPSVDTGQAPSGDVVDPTEWLLASVSLESLFVFDRSKPHQTLGNGRRTRQAR